MFFDLIWSFPILYYQKLSIFVAINALFYSIIIFFISYIIQSFRNIIRKACSKLPFEKKEIDPFFSILGDKPTKNSKGKWISRFDLLLAFFQNLTKISAILLFSVIPSAFSGFGIYPIGVSMFLTLIIYIIIAWLYLEEELRKRDIKEDDGLHNRRTIKHILTMRCDSNPKSAWGLACLAIGFSLFIPYALQGTCICFYTEDYGIGFGTPELETTTTELFRNLVFQQQCPVGGVPCHVYATVPHDPSRYVFINVHAGYDVTSLMVYYDTQDNYNRNGVLEHFSEAISGQLDFDVTGRRSMHSALLSNLTPNTTYMIQIIYYGEIQYNGTYKTLPEGPSDIRIAMGGDVGSTLNAMNLTATLARFNPDIIFIGGDSAYDNANSACWHAWDKFFEMYENLGQQLGHMVPLVVGVGNHDVGFDANTGNSVDPEHLPNYFHFLPQHLYYVNGTATVPPVNQRLTYFYHVVGSAVFISLDSSYVVPFNDPKQMEMLLNISNPKNSYSEKGRYVYYHVPIYPTCIGDPDNTAAERNATQQVWSPIFEQFRFAGAFENHVHMFKQTFPLTQGQIDMEKGVIYFGDGNWGTIPNSCLDGILPGDLFEVWNNVNSLWIIDLFKMNYLIYPIDPQGNKIFKATSGNFHDLLNKIEYDVISS